MRNLSITLLLLVCISGCAMFNVYYAYNVSAKNIGELKLRDVIITSDKEFWHATGYLNKGATKTLGGLKPVPPNGIYTIVVQDMNKDRYSTIIDLHDKIGKGFRGEIVFLVDENYHVSYQLK